MMVDKAKRHSFLVAREHDVASATQVTRILAQEIGFSTVMQSMIATAISELATNIIKYAGQGDITVGYIQQCNQPGIEMIAEDSGPGISDRVKALSDNISTGGSLGLGLPGVRRMMDEFIMDSSEGYGTKIVVRKWKPM